MSSGFSTRELLKSASNYPVAKGDFDGHPFRGNQYEAGNSTGSLRERAQPQRLVQEGVRRTNAPRRISLTVRADGNVNPRTGKPSGGSKTPRTFDPSKSHVIVQGQRPGGTIFTRMIPAERGLNRQFAIGDTVRFYDSSGKPKGSGEVVGQTNPNRGTYSGLVPDRPLSFNEVL